MITAQDANSIYEVPLILEQEGLAQQVLDLLQLEARHPDLEQWRTLVERMNRPKQPLDIAIVGKYVQLNDAYLSVVESLGHSAIAVDREVNIRWVNAEDIESHGAQHFLSNIDGIVVPGGFGNRGVDGKIAAIEYARTQNIQRWWLVLPASFTVGLSLALPLYLYLRDDANPA